MALRHCEERSDEAIQEPQRLLDCFVAALLAMTAEAFGISLSTFRHKGPPMPAPQTALIVGASRGLGLGLAREYLSRGWRVIATVRDTEALAVRELQSEFKDAVEIESVDIVEQDQIAVLRRRLDDRAFDLIFVNAGVTNDPNQPIGEVATEEFVRVIVTNALGPMRIIEAFLDRLRRDGVAAVMSSGLGSVADNNGGGWEVYRASKAALNTLMKSVAARRAGAKQTFLIVSPGWVRTDMGGPYAMLDVATSARGIAAVVAARRGEGGVAFVDYRNRTIRW
jgi:NAD(P)-dependent dehydrogenase (short-subunit alcohol dehydrogenase family)